MGFENKIDLLYKFSTPHGFPGSGKRYPAKLKKNFFLQIFINKNDASYFIANNKNRIKTL